MKLLFLDIETAPNEVYAWGLFDQNLSISHIIQPGRTICFSAKWEGSKDIIFRSEYHHSHGDMIGDMWLLLEEADAVCHYNGKKFDIPILNKEFILQRQHPPSTYTQIDLYTTVRREFKFASNKLDYVCQQLGLGSKVTHRGMEFWKRCVEHDPVAWKQMTRYNKQDVRLLERLYRHLQPWIKSHPNRGLFIDTDKLTCPKCGSRKIVKDGKYYAKTLTYQRYRCNSCGACPRDPRALEKRQENILV